MKILRRLCLHACRTLLVLLALLLPTVGRAQTTVAAPATIEGWVDRLARFGKAIPQEKVFVHMDNTCYFLGDTIWYAAYTRRTDKDVPSGISRVLYVELLNQDGYLVERQLVEMKHGRGHGCFALHDTLYGGYYELRAYTRWQLNWGQVQHPHTKYAEEWFYNRAMAREYYRDYEKLYSRVFPVYDKPQAPGEFYHDMTTRPLRRTYQGDAEGKELRISFYPEGGRLVGGAACHLAFEATDDLGKWVEGTMTLQDREGKTVAEAPVQSRGRGVLTFTPLAGGRYQALFKSDDGRTASASVNRVPEDGVALHVCRKGDAWEVEIQAVGAAARQPLGMTLMHEGVVRDSRVIDGEKSHFSFPVSQLAAGVNQLTVFDVQGRVWADRLFFVNTPDVTRASLSIYGMKESYAAYEPVTLQVAAPSLAETSGTGSSFVSVAVRDAAKQDYTYDSGNILTEMLLSSEVKGFVPQPDYFFEADDEEHRTALDLLMLTQGWRRFDWHVMAVPGAFALTHPAETQTQMLSGVVHKYTAVQKDDAFLTEVQQDHQRFMEEDAGDLESQWDEQDAAAEQEPLLSSADEQFEQMAANSKKDIVRETQYRTDGTMASSRFYADEGHLKREVRVHAEFMQGGSEGVVGDVDTEKGCFRLQVPHFYDACVFFLAASDTVHWKGGKEPSWVSMNEEEYPEFYVRLSFPYPRFVKPYSYYQTLLAPAPKGYQVEPEFAADGTTLMQAVTVQGRRRGLRRFDASKPAFVVDAYEAFNAAADVGLNTAWYQGSNRFVTDIARTYIGDMNMERAYSIETRYNTKNTSSYHSEGVLNEYNKLYNLEKVYVYTDYSPRREGLRSFEQDNQPTVTVDLRRPDDQGMRVTYRDRRYILPGFNYPAEYYHPDYQRTPPAEGTKDYRRTLYWNPDLQLDQEGKATIHFFTGSRPATLAVAANGQAANGTLLTNP